MSRSIAVLLAIVRTAPPAPERLASVRTNTNRASIATLSLATIDVGRLALIALLIPARWLKASALRAPQLGTVDGSFR
jgi:hypothetical protein